MIIEPCGTQHIFAWEVEKHYAANVKDRNVIPLYWAVRRENGCHWKLCVHIFFRLEAEFNVVKSFSQIFMSTKFHLDNYIDSCCHAGSPWMMLCAACNLQSRNNNLFSYGYPCELKLYHELTWQYSCSHMTVILYMRPALIMTLYWCMHQCRTFHKQWTMSCLACILHEPYSKGSITIASPLCEAPTSSYKKRLAKKDSHLSDLDCIRGLENTYLHHDLTIFISI